MAYSEPSDSRLQHIAERLGFELSAHEASEYGAFIRQMSPAFRLVEQLTELPAGIRHPRVPGFRPEGSDNPYNAWYYRSTIQGSPEGKLSGKRLAIKDCISVAGVPMTNGASILDGYVPDVDATVVSRILEAGGVILGKSACEYLCFAGNSATSSTGPVENPRVPGHTTGGSSNGSAALVAAGEVDLALGADQAGSIRMPASFCGIVGHKPTYGLVPYTGALSIEYSFDHLGPMADSVEDCALLLEVLAGEDGIDGRQVGVRTEDYTTFVGRGVRQVRIGVVAEGFGRPESEAGVDETVERALARLAAAGAVVERVSMPWHTHGAAIWLPIGLEGPYHNLVKAHGVSYGANEAYPLSFMRAFSGWEAHANELAPTIKTVLLSGAILDEHGGRLYAKARNLSRRLRAEHDALLRRYDVLVMPTTPMTATRLIAPEASIGELLSLSWTAMGNTCPTNLTGHPAISVPCGTVDGKPVGLMIVGRHYEDGRVFQVAHAVQETTRATLGKA